MMVPQGDGVEGILLDREDFLHHRAIEHPSNPGRRRLQGGPDPLEQGGEGAGRDLGELAGDGVIGLAAHDDARVVVLDETGEVLVRPQRRHAVPGVVIAVVDARLVVVGCACEQLVTGLQEQHPLARAGEVHGQVASEVTPPITMAE